MKLCDLHTHVLPGVDDGAPTMEYALQMLKNAVASDVECLAITPHCNSPHGIGNYLDQDLKDRFSQLQKMAEALPIRLVLGAEVFVNEEFPEYLKRNMFPTINNSRYLLTEFLPNTEEELFGDTLQLILESGKIPLIAHPERYAAVARTPHIVEEWLDLGCHIQLTGGSILGVYGKTVQKTAAVLLKNDYVACVASDAHGIHRRSNYLMDIYDHLAIRYSKGYAQHLMYLNPMRICLDETL